MPAVTIEEMKNVVALRDLPDEQLQWILERSEYCEYTDGGIVAKYGDPADMMWISLTGKIAFYMYINGRQVYYFTFENDNITGGIGGLMPYSRMKTIPGYSYALGDVKLLRLHKKYFQELERLNPDFIQRLIGYMTERAKAFATTQLQYEKVNALGNLAAGIAHELNNPAAAISEISNELLHRLDRNVELTKQLLTDHVTPQQLQHLHTLVIEKEGAPQQKQKLGTLQQMAYDDEMEEWLEANGITDRATAETYAEAGYSVAELNTLHQDLGDGTFIKLNPWLENLISTRKIVKDLAESASRISSLVSSIKSHVHMDRTNDLQPTNIHTDIENTLTLLGFKLREKNIEVLKKFGSDIPNVPAYVGELNQVWTNLIDNAIAAVEKNGTITIVTAFNGRDVTVSVIDNGVGIPNENLSRIFDPFFTTKKVGEGTGMGLDIVNRIVKRHKGDIKVTSEPGRTQFSICIPAVPPTSS